MTDKIKKGSEGEQLAASYLEKKGYVILERNYRYKHAEIDLIVQKDEWLVFVEVKTRGSHQFGFPEEFVDDQKAEKIGEGAEQYILEKEWMNNVRYDIISITIKNGIPDILHFEDAIQ